MENYCICCGEIIPEGMQICPNCEKEPCTLKERHNMDNIIEAMEYCLTKGKCTDCKFSKGRMFTTCRYLVEDMSKRLKERKEVEEDLNNSINFLRALKNCAMVAENYEVTIDLETLKNVV